MKPLFGIDVTENPENETPNGETLVVRTLPQAVRATLEKSTKEYERTIEKSRMPRWFRMLRNMCGYFALIVLVAVVSNLSGLGLAKMMEQSPFLIISAVFALVGWAVMLCLSLKRSRLIEREAEEAGVSNALQQSIEAAYHAMDVPKNAVSADVLSFSYRIRNGEIKPCASALQTTPFCNLDLKVYLQNGMLCLADVESVTAVSLSSLVGIHTVQKRISIPVWSKEISHKEGIYQQYHLRTNGLRDVSFKPYHVLEFTHEGESFGIWFPCYELPTFEKLTGLSAEEEVE